MSDHGHAEAHAEPAHDAHAAPAAEHHDAHAPAADHGHDAHGGGGNKVEQMRNDIDAQRAGINAKIDKASVETSQFLRFGKPGTPKKENILLEPVYAIGDMIDATAGTAARRIWEIVETTGASIGATLNMAINPILHPLNTLKHPLKYIANFGRIFTTSIENYSNIFNAIPRSIQEVYERGIQRPTSRLIGRIPVIGKGVEKLTNGLGWLLEKPRELTEFLSKPIYAMDDWMKAAQAA